MKVILLKTIKNLGQTGEVKMVSDGFARNYLLPKGLAEPTTKQGLFVREAQMKKKEKMGKLEVRSKKSEAKKLSEKIFTITVKTDDKGSLYEKISAKTIATHLQEQGHKVNESDIKLAKAIKKIGEYDVDIKLAGEKVVIKLKVESENNNQR